MTAGKVDYHCPKCNKVGATLVRDASGAADVCLKFYGAGFERPFQRFTLRRSFEPGAELAFDLTTLCHCKQLLRLDGSDAEKLLTWSHRHGGKPAHASLSIVSITDDDDAVV